MNYHPLVGRELTHKWLIETFVDAFEHVRDWPVSQGECVCRSTTSLVARSRLHFLAGMGERGRVEGENIVNTRLLCWLDKQKGVPPTHLSIYLSVYLFMAWGVQIGRWDLIDIQKGADNNCRAAKSRRWVNNYAWTGHGGRKKVVIVKGEKCGLWKQRDHKLFAH